LDGRDVVLVSTTGWRPCTAEAALGSLRRSNPRRLILADWPTNAMES
jgi:hypothetical protein